MRAEKLYESSRTAAFIIDFPQVRFRSVLFAALQLTSQKKAHHSWQTRGLGGECHELCQQLVQEHE